MFFIKGRKCVFLKREKVCFLKGRKCVFFFEKRRKCFFKGESVFF